MPLDRARPDAHELGGVPDRPAGRHIGGENVRLALRRLRREGAAQVPVSHGGANSLTGPHSGRARRLRAREADPADLSFERDSRVALG